jgi:hypothetical protein
MKKLVPHLPVAPLLALALSLAVAGCGGGGISGTYEARAPEGEDGAMTIEFLSGQRAKVTISGGGGFNMGFTGTYETDGDQVTISSPEGAADDDVVLTKKGDTLTGEMLGDQLVFEKK